MTSCSDDVGYRCFGGSCCLHLHVTPCSDGVGYRRFGWSCCLHLQPWGSMALRNCGILPQHYTASRPENLDVTAVKASNLAQSYPEIFRFFSLGSPGKSRICSLQYQIPPHGAEWYTLSEHGAPRFWNSCSFCDGVSHSFTMFCISVFYQHN